MQLIPEEYKIKTNRNDLINLNCPYCDRLFKVKRFLLQRNIKAGRLKFCSAVCSNLHQQNRITCRCDECGCEFERTKAWSNRIIRNFCSQTCSGRYNNKHKTFGVRRSKLECWIEAKLKSSFPELDFQFNKKDAIESELDVYIPSLKIAFELNGIYHYKPIHGEKVLLRIQRNDENKKVHCKNKKIELNIIDVSSQIRFAESNSEKFLKLIEQKILNRLAASSGCERTPNPLS